MADHLKPVKLQVNTSGAWRDVVSFDAADPVNFEKVMEAAQTLGDVTGAAFRIVIRDGQQTCLRSWSPGKGWRIWRALP